MKVKNENWKEFDNICAKTTYMKKETKEVIEDVVEKDTD